MTAFDNSTGFLRRAALSLAATAMLGAAVFAPDGDHYVFNYFRVLSELYIVDGLK